MKYDTLIIGAGHNGLVAALYLARAGHSVVVVEKSDQPGGLCRSNEFAPGYTVPGLLHDSSSLSSSIVSELELEKYGLTLREEIPPVLVPSVTGRSLIIHEDPGRAPSGLNSPVKEDISGYQRWRGDLARKSGLVARLMEQAPPPLGPDSISEIFGLLRTGIFLRRLGSEEMLDLLRVAPMSAADWLSEYFRNDNLGAALAAPSLLGSFVGPRQPGTAANLLIYESLRDRPIDGGPAALIKALLSAAEAGRVKIHTDAEAAEIRVREGRAVGVTLLSGEELDAERIVSSCDPKQTFLRLLRPASLDVEVVRQFQAVRTRGVVAKVHFALDGAPAFSQVDSVQFERGRMGGDLTDLEKAFDAPKYGELTSRPYLDLSIPSVADKDLAPSGHHVLSVAVYCVAYDIKGGWTKEKKEALLNAVLDTFDRYGSSLRDQVLATEVLTPADLEESYGVTGGHLCHVESALDQALFMRPTFSSGRYATPLKGLFLGGSGSHPGGGVTGLPGALAAKTILKR